MQRNIFIANRLREVFIHGRWIANTNYRELLQSVDWLQATLKVADLNTIAALTYHINYYLDGLLRAFENGKLDIRDAYSFDLPPINSESDWNTLVAALLSNSEQFAARIEQMDDKTLDEVFIDEKYGTYIRNIEGVIEHSYYHLGQISLIKKLISQDQRYSNE